ncbi:MAG: hypothetical protein WA123_11010 [Methylotenera sp.]
MKSFISSHSCNFLSFRQWVKACHVVMVYLAFSIFWVSGVVAQPSFIESATTIPGNEMAELSNGGLQIRECRFEESVFVSRPVSDYWIDSSKLCENSSAELNGGSIKFVESKVKISNVTAKAGQRKSANNGEPEISDGFKYFWQFMALTLMLNFIFYAGSNKRHKQQLLDAQRKSEGLRAFAQSLSTDGLCVIVKCIRTPNTIRYSMG